MCTHNKEHTMPLIIRDKVRYAEYCAKRLKMQEQIEPLFEQIQSLRRKLKRRIRVARALDRKYRDTHYYVSNHAGGR